MFVRSNDRITVCGPLSSGNYTVRGDLSSQFISGLMLALPLLRDNSIVEVTEPFESAPYTEITQSVQKDFGVCIDREHTRFTIRGHSAYDSRSYTVEGDYSNAAYFDALTMLGGDVKGFNLTPESPQGDSVYRHYFKQLSKGFTTIDLANTPDLGPIMFAVAAAMGGAEFTGTARLRLKESDRLVSMKAELAKFGIPMTIGANSVIIHNTPLQTPAEVLCGHNDHRVIMALSLLCTITGGQIGGAEAVAKSYPSYFDHLQQLGIQLQMSNVD
jgi:3-phosphoshikimate 1-carboxyvinyltransferase